MEGVPYQKRGGKEESWGEDIRYVGKGEGGVVGKRRGGKGVGGVQEERGGYVTTREVGRRTGGV